MFIWDKVLLIPELNKIILFMPELRDIIRTVALKLRVLN